MKAYLTIGMAASGKTTWAESQTGYTNINLDDCRFEVCGDAGNHEATAQAAVLHDEKIKVAASKGFDIIISDTNLNEKYRQLLIDKLIGLGYEVDYVLFPISLEIAKERNNQRKRVVPENIIEVMFQKFSETNLSGKILLENELVPSELISSFNQLVNLEILTPSPEIISLKDKLLELDLIILNGQDWSPGAKLESWMKDRGLLNYSIFQYLHHNLESILEEKMTYWDDEFSISSIVNKVDYLFCFPLSENKKIEIASTLIENKSLIKTCFDANGNLFNSGKLSEIIKEIIK